MTLPKPKLPYGNSDFEKIQSQGMYYVDKTHFIPELEAAGDFLFLIRPRRFGKSTWVSILQSYYDLNKADRFERIFGKTWIGSHPTEERNRYLILYFNFSAVSPETEHVESSFENYGKAEIRSFLNKYASFFEERDCADILQQSTITDQLNTLFTILRGKPYKLYLIIDEYDNFTNTILSLQGEDAYHKITRGSGFFRYFFNVLKVGTSASDSGLARMFLTGVSPVTLDDVTSGMNIGYALHLLPKFNAMLGFTEEEVRQLLETYRSELPEEWSTDELLDMMKTWFGGYRFSRRTGESMFNANMVLYFLKESMNLYAMPTDLIDPNVRVDYNKLKHLIVLNRRLNGNFDRLKQILEQHEVNSDIAKSFPFEELRRPENFVSLLYYFGLLTIERLERQVPVLRIPNRTILQFMYGYLRQGFSDVDTFKVNIVELSERLRDMAYAGKAKPVFDLIAGEIQKQTRIRDYLSGEKVVQSFLLAYLNVVDCFISYSEYECEAGKVVDIFLHPFFAKYPDATSSYLIEVKYLPRKGFTETKKAAKLRKARQQLETYRQASTVRHLTQQTTLKSIILLFCGWEMVHYEEI